MTIRLTTSWMIISLILCSVNKINMLHNIIYYVNKMVKQSKDLSADIIIHVLKYQCILI